MSATTDIKEIREAIRFIPMQIEELRGDITRIYSLYGEELKEEKKRDRSLKQLLLNLPHGSPYWKAAQKTAARIRDRSYQGPGR
jgi:hypothetical protein